MMLCGVNHIMIIMQNDTIHNQHFCDKYKSANYLSFPDFIKFKDINFDACFAVTYGILGTSQEIDTYSSSASMKLEKSLKAHISNSYGSFTALGHSMILELI